MMRAIHLAAAALAISLSAAAAAPTPRTVSASYDVLWNGTRVAVMNETFEAKGGSYRIVSESRATGLLALFAREPLRLESSGQVTAAGLQPLRFEGKRGDDDPRRARADFDWSAGRLTLTHDGATEHHKLPSATQDLASLMYQFMFLDLANRGKFELAMTNGRKLNQHWYTIQPGGELDTAFGRIATLHLVKQHRPDESGAEIWLAPQHHQFPVRMVVLDDDGSRVEHVLTKFELTP